MVERILASPQFEKSPRLRELFTYIMNNAIAGHTEYLKEQSIGSAVFKRASAYDPAADNVVRVQVRQVRLKLDDYFSGPGQNEPLIIEIPRGSYIPFFRERVAAGIPGVPLRERQWRIGAIAAIALLLISIGVIVWQASRLGSTANDVGARALFWPWTELLDGPRQTLVVVSDPSIWVVGRLLKRHVPLDDYSNPAYPAQLIPADAPDQIASVARLTGSLRVTSDADLVIASELSRLLAHHADRITIRLAREVTFREIQEHNLILLGGRGSNPWVSLFDNELNFKLQPDPANGAPSFHNQAPFAGEAPRYTTTAMTPNPGPAYGVIAMLRHPNHSGRVVLVQGATMEASEGVGRFLLQSTGAGSLRRRLPAAGRDQGFEALLKVRAIGGSATESALVAIRSHP